MLPVLGKSKVGRVIIMCANKIDVPCLCRASCEKLHACPHSLYFYFTFHNFNITNEHRNKILGEGNKEKEINSEKIEFEFELGDAPDIGIIEGSTEQEDIINFKLGDGPDVGIIEGFIEQEYSI